VSRLSEDAPCAIWKRACGDFWRGHRESVFFHGHRSGLRAMEMKADVILKATRVEGILRFRPGEFADAKFMAQITIATCCTGI